MQVGKEVKPQHNTVAYGGKQLYSLFHYDS